MAVHTILIGIAGGSGSGKTYLARRVAEMAGPGVANVLSMDQYFRADPSDDPEDINFDHPNHVEFDLLVQHLHELHSGAPVRVPQYDFVNRRRTVDAIEVTPAPILLVEGLFVLLSPVLECLDFTCFLDVAEDQRLLGRILRDRVERQGELEAVIDRYQRFVRPSYDIFVAPSRNNADIVVDFTYRRAFFTHLLAHIARDYAQGTVDLHRLVSEIRSEVYTPGYEAGKAIMREAIDIRRLAEAYPESVRPSL